VLVDVSSCVMRPLIPAQLRRAVFSAVHSLAHPSVRATRCLIASRFLWPGLARDVAQWCKDCVQCQRAKVTKQHAAPMKPIPEPAARFSHGHVDLVGPLPEAGAAFSTSLPPLIGRLAGRRLFPCVPLQLLIVHVSFFLSG
jgi:hypothetical protein